MVVLVGFIRGNEAPGGRSATGNATGPPSWAVARMGSPFQP